jgi:AraC-like DNA-binding protein
VSQHGIRPAPWPLHQTDASLAEIALKIGYGSEFSFAKAFKRAFGIAPGTYRGQPHRVPGLSRGPIPPCSRRTSLGRFA